MHGMHRLYAENFGRPPREALYTVTPTDSERCSEYQLIMTYDSLVDI